MSHLLFKMAIVSQPGKQNGAKIDIHNTNALNAGQSEVVKRGTSTHKGECGMHHDERESTKHAASGDEDA